MLLLNRRFCAAVIFAYSFNKPERNCKSLSNGRLSLLFSLGFVWPLDGLLPCFKTCIFHIFWSRLLSSCRWYLQEYSPEAASVMESQRSSLRSEYGVSRVITFTSENFSHFSLRFQKRWKVVFFYRLSFQLSPSPWTNSVWLDRQEMVVHNSEKNFCQHKLEAHDQSKCRSCDSNPLQWHQRQHPLFLHYFPPCKTPDPIAVVWSLVSTTDSIFHAFLWRYRPN